MRSDLLALTPESLVVLANVGLVKRAQKEIDSGVGPTIEEEGDGTIVARSRDGATTRIPPGTPLKATACTCGSATVCRHRVAAVLAYRHTQAGAATPSATAGWDPGSITDEALEAFCGDVVFARARNALRASVMATVRVDGIPSVSLPSSTVQFLAPNDLAFAKCDCSKGHACEHVVVAVWAFRQRAAGGVVELGSPDDGRTAHALEHVETTLGTVAELGIIDMTMPAVLGTARSVSDRAGLLWITDALEQLERQKEAYDRQSALYSARTCSLLVGELLARVRAAKHSHVLPPRWIIGSDEARETPIEQVRLVSLGTRLDADGARRFAEVYFAESDTKTVLVLRKTWTFAEGEQPRNGHDLGHMFASSKLSLTALAKGELITRAAKRRANGEIDLSAARGMKASPILGTAVWSDLPEPIVLRELATHEAFCKTQPPVVLRPRRVGDRVHVVGIGRVVDCDYDVGAQELTGIVEDAAGNRLILRAPYRTVSPGAVDALRDGLEEAPRFVSGELKRTSNGWEMYPLAIAGDRLRVLDLEKPRQNVSPAVRTAERALDPFGVFLQELDEFIDRGIVRGAGAVQSSASALAERLGEAGMARIALLVKDLGAGQKKRLLDLAMVRTLVEEAAFASPSSL